MTTYPALQKGGKHGAVFTAGDPKKSRLVEEITGEEPSMPKEGDPLSKEAVQKLEESSNSTRIRTGGTEASF